MLVFDTEINTELSKIYKTGKLTWIYNKLTYGTPPEIVYGDRLLRLIDIDKFKTKNPFIMISILRAGYANYSRFPSWKLLRDTVMSKYPESISRMHGLHVPYESSGIFDFPIITERNMK